MTVKHHNCRRKDKDDTHNCKGDKDDIQIHDRQTSQL